MPNPLDIRIGDVYARLTVIEEPFSKRSPKGKMERFVNCKCICGTVKVVSLNKLRMKKTLSCGCYNKEIVSKKKKMSDEDRIKNSLFREYKLSAKQRNLDFNLSAETLFSKVHEPCAYCGKPPSKPHRKCENFLYNGLDRVDNSVGYIESNVVPCCYICNKMKGVLTKEKFVEHLIKIYTRTG